MAKKKNVKTLNPKKKTMGEISKSVDAKTTPKSNVKILKRGTATATERAIVNKTMNKVSTKITKDAKSGKTAKKIAGYVKESNKNKPKTVIKIRSGGAGIGGIFGVKNR